ncbi:MAG: 4Fe-4S binding protein [Desulfosalsimonas sp.]
MVGTEKGLEMSIQPKKSFAIVDYEKCNPSECNPETGVCAAVPACEHKVIKQLDGAFEPPMIFHDLCMGCWECMEACPLDAIQVKEVN